MRYKNQLISQLEVGKFTIQFVIKIKFETLV